MKTLEQLGISPAPWSIDDHNNIRTTDGHTLAATMVSNAYGHDRTEQDAFIIAAAPDMYKHGVELVSSLEDWMRKYPPSEFSTFGQAYQLLVEATNNFRAALTKAAGESEVKE